MTMPAHESQLCIYISEIHNVLPKIFLELVIAITHYIKHERGKCFLLWKNIIPLGEFAGSFKCSAVFRIHCVSLFT